MTAWNALLAEHTHRPWPLAARPWVMTMTWADLLFAHWTVPVEKLRERVPPSLELDTFDGRAYLGVVPFRMEAVGPRGLGWLPSRLPSPRAFPELNVRTYVRAGEKPGVFFFSLDATSRLAVWGARTFFDLPYVNAEIHVAREDGSFRYESRRRDPRGGEGAFAGTYRPEGEPYLAEPGSLEHWLTERYCLYTIDSLYTVDSLNAIDPRGRLRRSEVHHVQWPLRRASAEIEVNTVAEAQGFELVGPAEHLHFVDRIDVLAWWPEDV